VAEVAGVVEEAIARAEQVSVESLRAADGPA
jgi:hypothetical protein